MFPDNHVSNGRKALPEKRFFCTIPKPPAELQLLLLAFDPFALLWNPLPGFRLPRSDKRLLSDAACPNFLSSTFWPFTFVLWTRTSNQFGLPGCRKLPLEILISFHATSVSAITDTIFGAFQIRASRALEPTSYWISVTTVNFGQFSPGFSESVHL
jgi:hypothetical protein